MVGVVEAGVIAALVGVDAFAYAKYSESEKKLKDASIASGSISKEEYDYLTGNNNVAIPESKSSSKTELVSDSPVLTETNEEIEKTNQPISFISPYAQMNDSSSNIDFKEFENKLHSHSLKIQTLQTKVNSFESELSYIKESTAKIESLETEIKNLSERETLVENNEHKFNTINESLDVVSQRLTELENKVSSIENKDVQFTDLFAKLRETENEEIKLAPESAVSLSDESIDRIDFENVNYEQTEQIKENEQIQKPNMEEFHNQLQTAMDDEQIQNEQQTLPVTVMEDDDVEAKNSLPTNISQTVIFPSPNQQIDNGMFEKLNSIEAKLLEISSKNSFEGIEKRFDELEENLRTELMQETDRISKKLIGLQKKETFKLSKKISKTSLNSSKTLKKMNVNLKKSISSNKLMAQLALKNSKVALRLSERNNNLLVKTTQPELKKIKEIANLAKITSKKLEKQNLTVKPATNKTATSMKIKKTLTIKKTGSAKLTASSPKKQIKTVDVKLIESKPAKIKQENVTVIKQKPKHIDEETVVSEIIQSVEKEERKA